MNRRDFLAMLAAAAAHSGCRTIFVGGTDDFDRNLMVFLADIHVEPGEQCEGWQKRRVMAHVAEILRMDPLPGNVICLVDLARTYGTADDYKVFGETMRPLVDAGIKVTYGMGNHDCREPFWEVFPSYAEQTEVEGRIVRRLETPHADFLLLDTLDATPVKPGVKRNKGGGVIDAAQLEWFKEYCAKADRPLFAGAHHSAMEMPRLAEAVVYAPKVYGFIHGHNHRWFESFVCDGYKTGRTVQCAGLPSTGYWGDIGYATLRLGASSARLTCRQTEFFFPNPFAYERVPTNWTRRTAEHDGATLVFEYDK